jgi:ABC-2 type transport system permease protein
MSAATEALAAPAPISPRPFYWSVRREFWEHRALYIVPLVVAALMLVSFALNAVHLPDGMRLLAAMEPGKQRAAVIAVLLVTASAIMSAQMISNAFYCLDALHSERRDRSVLFWKSLPVSDFTTVVSKLFVAFAVVPAIALVVVIATQLFLLVLSSIVLLVSGTSAQSLLSLVPYPELIVLMLYGSIAFTVWLLPIYGYLLLVSAWAKRSTFIWAVLVPLGIAVFEKLVFDTSYFIAAIKDRLLGWASAAFAHAAQSSDFASKSEGMEAYADLGGTFPDSPLQIAAPLQYLSDPHLWIGLALAAAFIAAAIWMRRYREPM